MNNIFEIELFKKIFQTLKTDVVVFNSQGEILYSEWFSIDFLGLCPADKKDFENRFLYEQDQVEKFNSFCQNTVEAEFFHEFSLATIHKQQVTFLIKATKQKIKNDEILIVSLSDVSEKQNLLCEIENLERLSSVGQMAAGIAHEFNNILTAMMGWTQLAVRATTENEQAQAALTTIENNTFRARTIANQLLEVAKPEVINDLTSINVGDSIFETLKFLSWDISNARLNLITDIKNTSECLANHTRLIQVFINVLKNAIDATPEGGYIKVSTVEKSEIVEIIFEDSGPGVPEHVLNNVFEPFYTTKRKISKIHGGSGLGMSISKKIINDFKGNITISNRSEGGAKVTICLPCSEIENNDKDITKDKPSSLPPGISILVVDDEPDICEMIKMALSIRGAHVVSETDGQAALQRCKEELFNAAFIDFAMTGLSGHNLSRAIKEVQPETAIIFMSGVEIPSTGSNTNCDFLKKPFDLNDIQTKLREILDRDNN